MLDHEDMNTRFWEIVRQFEDEEIVRVTMYDVLRDLAEVAVMLVIGIALVGGVVLLAEAARQTYG